VTACAKPGTEQRFILRSPPSSTFLHNHASNPSLNLPFSNSPFINTITSLSPFPSFFPPLRRRHDTTRATFLTSSVLALSPENRHLSDGFARGPSASQIFLLPAGGFLYSPFNLLFSNDCLIDFNSSAPKAGLEARLSPPTHAGFVNTPNLPNLRHSFIACLAFLHYTHL
jgi:hypothetical protein